MQIRSFWRNPFSKMAAVYSSQQEVNNSFLLKKNGGDCAKCI